MGFGVSDAGVISKQTNNTVETASKTDENGTILEEKSYGGVNEVTEEVFVDAGSFTNEALNGQTGNTTTGIVVEHSMQESNEAYTRSTKRTRKPLAAPA